MAKRWHCWLGAHNWVECYEEYLAPGEPYRYVNIDGTVEIRYHSERGTVQDRPAHYCKDCGKVDDLAMLRIHGL